MLAVEKWGLDKHPIIALIAPQLAASSRDISDIYRNLKKHQIANHSVQIPRLTKWYALYRSNKQYTNIFTQFLFEASPLCESLVNFGTAISGLQQDNEKSTFTISPDRSLDLQNLWMNIQTLSNEEMRDDFEDKPLAPEKWSTVQRFLAQYQMELSFIFLVFTPCLMLYQISPGRLYHKARLGDVNSIDKLLRLDPLMLHDPSIGQQIQKIRLFGKSSTYQNLVEAPLKPIKVKISRSKVKASLGALISLMADLLKQPITSTEIRKLFDAIAQDSEKRDIDSSLPDSSETFYKSIQRNRPAWKTIIHPDKKK